MTENNKKDFGKIETRQVRFRVTAPPLIGIVQRQRCPLDGTITQVCYHFAPGANQLVQVALRYGTVQISPITGFISLDDATPVFPISQPCRGEEDLELIVQNTDILNPHTISCIVTIIGESRPIKLGDEGK